MTKKTSENVKKTVCIYLSDYIYIYISLYMCRPRRDWAEGSACQWFEQLVEPVQDGR